MSKTLLTAVSLSALMAFGATACAKKADESKEAASETETAHIETDEAVPYVGAAVIEPEIDPEAGVNDEARLDETLGDEALADEALAETEQFAEAEPEINAEPSSPLEAELEAELAAELAAAEAAARGEGEVITIAEVRDEEDVTEMVDSAFAKADLDGDGSLNKEEFAALAAAVEIGEPEDEASDLTTAAIDTAANEVSDVIDEETGIDAAETLETITGDEAEPAMVLPGEEIFAEAAGSDEELTKEDLRASFLARFETADANHDATLDESEQEEFARLAMGKRNK